MKRELQKHDVSISTVGKDAWAFVPAPLPSEPPIEWTPELRGKFDQALLALERPDARTYEAKCITCIWACRMPVEMIIDHWNPSRKRYRHVRNPHSRR